MKKLTLIQAGALTTALLIGVAPATHAQDNTGAGCGLGAKVMDGKSGKGANILASLLNGVVPNTFFMTTGGGTMGCDPTQTVQNEQATEIFVASNMDQLSTDVAQGGGEHLNVLANLMGIADEDRASFQQLAQQHYDQLFVSEGDAKGIIQTMEVAMLNDSNLSKYAVN
ncbi:DUF3015 family protein [Granulosicoccus antarcticus]|uniref:DUF3015 domain-containing protein n=1 Tax=Granulosicoccus antarcticus IMCC3135 TaxID=1192854 RepID=A0A2Z2NMB3_9GAMM|nr:DUF3015 family protein [Granulosicoccus antarcticus]ASJ72582.1 hypothetical protein IMCC3135_12470 [Granulosicoccus antarcticus IMCC3135]